MSARPAFDHPLAAAGRGVQVRLLLRADDVAGGLVRTAGRRRRLPPLTDPHAKLLITDTTG